MKIIRSNKFIFKILLEIDQTNNLYPSFREGEWLMSGAISGNLVKDCWSLRLSPKSLCNELFSL